MAGGPASDWGQEILRELGTVKAAVGELSTKVDAQTTGLADFKQKAQPYFTNLDSAKWLLNAVIGGGIPAIAASIWHFASLISTTGHHEKAIDEYRKDIKDLLKATAGIQTVLQKKEEPVRMASYDGLSWYREQIGHIARIDKNEITLVEPLGKAKTERIFPIAQGARFIVNGKAATFEDFRPGMSALVLYNPEGIVQLVEKAEEKKGVKPFAFPPHVDPLPDNVPPKPAPKREPVPKVDTKAD